MIFCSRILSMSKKEQTGCSWTAGKGYSMGSLFRSCSFLFLLRCVACAVRDVAVKVV